MEKGLTISVQEAQEILEIMTNLEGEFAGCDPTEGDCKGEFDPLSAQCSLCARLKAFLILQGKEE